MKPSCLVGAKNRTDDLPLIQHIALPRSKRETKLKGNISAAERIFLLLRYNLILFIYDEIVVALFY